jgi:hypothetical protein
MAKTRSRKEVMTIPDLRKAMTDISAYAKNLVKKSKGNMKYAVKSFQGVWQDTFNKPLGEKIAKEYLAHISKHRSKTMKRGGGGPMAPAPLGYRMEPGTSLPYGNNMPYVDYLNKGFVIPMSDNIANCGKVDSTVTVPANMGSNLVKTYGGKRKGKTIKKKRGGNIFTKFVNEASQIVNRPFQSTTPPSIQADLYSQYRGQLPAPGGQAYQTTYQYRTAPDGLVPLPGALLNAYNPAISIRTNPAS